MNKTVEVAIYLISGLLLVASAVVVGVGVRNNLQFRLAQPMSLTFTMKGMCHAVKGITRNTQGDVSPASFRSYRVWRDMERFDADGICIDCKLMGGRVFVVWSCSTNDKFGASRTEFDQFLQAHLRFLQLPPPQIEVDPNYEQQYTEFMKSLNKILDYNDIVMIYNLDIEKFTCIRFNKKTPPKRRDDTLLPRWNDWL